MPATTSKHDARATLVRRIPTTGAAGTGSLAADRVAELLLGIESRLPEGLGGSRGCEGAVRTAADDERLRFMARRVLQERARRRRRAMVTRRG